MPKKCWRRRASCPEPMAVLRLRLTRGHRPRGTGRRRGRFWRMIGSPMIWPAMGALALAVGLGVQLGDSAVREIDPLYFQGPAGRPMGIDPVPAAAPSAYAQAYGWEQGNAARLAASGIDYPYAPTPVSLVEPIVEPARREAPPPPPPSLAPWPPGQVSIQPEIERYTDYPIERKDADSQAPDEELAPPDEINK